MAVSLVIGAHARAIWAVDAPHTDVVHANASVRVEKGMANISTSSPSDPRMRQQAKGR
jgi:phosphate-selective porin